MIIMLLIGLALFGYAISLVARTLGMRRLRVTDTLDGMRLYGFQQPAPTGGNARPGGNFHGEGGGRGRGGHWAPPGMTGSQEAGPAAGPAMSEDPR